MLLLSLLGGLLTKGVSCRTKQYLLLLILLVQESYGHLVLTYPPARQYPLDFSDNYRTRPPCGMPKIPELVSYTNIPAGSAVDLSWHIAYPHRGGSAFELRSNNEKVLWRYPWTGWILADDVSQLNISLALPNEVCENCTLRMLKQAREWGGGYTFWSCTDINLVNTTIPDDERCSFRGNFDGSKCICDRTYEGDKCQYKNECVDDSDCSNNGHCIDTNSTRYPKLQCYCNAGWYGRACEKESNVNNSSQIDFQNYKHRSLAEEYDLYHRILSDTSEVEVVLKVKSVTWVGIGWRSNSAGSTCQNFPVNDVTIAPGARPAPISNGEPEPTGESNGEPTGEPEGEPSGEPEGEATGEPEGEPTGEPEGEATGEPEGEATREPEGEPTGEPEGEPTGEPEGEPTGEPEGEPTWEPTGEPTGEPEGEPTGEPEGEPTGKPEREPTGEPEGEPTGEPTGEPEKESTGEPTNEPNSEPTSEPYAPNPCDGSCNSTRNCLFDVHWKHDKKSQILKFTMSAPGSSNHYLAIGFSTNEMMAKSDIVVGLMDSTQPLITDRWAESRSKPTVDKTGNLQHISGSFVNGELTFSFSRPLASPDTVEDTDLTTKTCVYLLTAMGTTANNDITYHSDSRASSSNTFCFDKCPKYDDKSSSSEPTGEPEGEPTGEPNGEPTEKPTGEPTGEPNGEPSGEPKGEPTGEPKGEPTGEPKGEPTGEPNGEPSGEPNGEPSGEPEGEPTGEPNGEPTGEPKGEPTGEPKGEPTGEPEGETTGRGNLHAMDCIDIVIGTAKGQLSRIGDYYTRDRSTPLFDEEYGGKDDLTAAFGFEENGETTILFRRKLQATESTDWSIENNLMHIAWARGQQTGDIKHVPQSALETLEADSNYYRPDELKYHGHDNHRGADSFNFYESPPERINNCTVGGCTDPASCSFNVTWVYSSVDDSVTFDLKADVQENRWVAIGFSLDNQMPRTDIVAVYITPGSDGTPTVSDRYVETKSEPAVDAAQNTEMISGSRDGSVTHVVFKRRAMSPDLTSDVDLHSNGGSPDGCPYVFLGVGGDVNEAGVMSYHPQTPARIGRICFGICAGAGPIDVPTERPTADSTAETTAETTAGPTAAPTLIVTVPSSLRLVSEQYTSELADITSSRAQTLKNTLETELTPLMQQNIPGFSQITVRGFRPGSVVVDMDISARANDNNKDETAQTIKDTVTTVAATGDIAGYTVDTQNVTFGEVRTEPIVDEDNDDDDDDDDLNRFELIIIAVSAALVFVAFTVIVFKLWQNRKIQSLPKSHLSTSSGSSTPTGIHGKNSASTEFTDLRKGQPPTKFNSNHFKPQEKIYQPAYDNPGYAAPDNNSASYAVDIP